MTFLEFYSNNFVPLTVIFSVFGLIVLGFIIVLVRYLVTKKVKTPWFEISPETIGKEDPEVVGKTRLFLKRQLDYLDKYIDSLLPHLDAIFKALVIDATNELCEEDFQKDREKNLLTTCITNLATQDLANQLRYYLANLIVVNHIGTDEQKIKQYARVHVTPIIGIGRALMCSLYRNISGTTIIDLKRICQQAGIENDEKWIEEKLTELLYDLMDLRYSNFSSGDINEHIK